MLKFPKQKIIERLDALPENIQQLLTADELINTIWTIGEAHHLGEDRTGKLASIMGAIILGFLHNEDLSKAIVQEAQIDKRLAEEIAHELRLKILNPIMPEITAAFSYNMRGAPPIAPAPTPQPTQSVTLRPAFAPPIASDQPFILHEEQKESESVRPIDETLVRPTFYDPPSHEVVERQTGQEASGRPTAARLEIGGVEEGPEAEPRVGRTETEKIRVVHYSGPRTSIDPFAPQQRTDDKEQGVDPQQLSKDIHPENVVDLKDLPK